MTKKEKAKYIINELEKLYPETPVPLNHKDPFTLLIAVLLSAQCTDERVNKITPKLFQLADNPLREPGSFECCERYVFRAVPYGSFAELAWSELDQIDATIKVAVKEVVSCILSPKGCFSPTNPST